MIFRKQIRVSPRRVRLFVSLEDSAAYPELAEGIPPFVVSPVEDLRVSAQLEGCWWEEPQEPPRQRNHERDPRMPHDIARLLQVPAGHNEDGDGTAELRHAVVDSR